MIIFVGQHNWKSAGIVKSLYFVLSEMSRHVAGCGDFIVIPFCLSEGNLNQWLNSVAIFGEQCNPLPNGPMYDMNINIPAMTNQTLYVQ